MSERLAQRIDRLFRTRLNPMGKEFSYRQVARAISQNGYGAEQGEAVSATYIWALRTGVKTNPTMRHLQALARFFDVSPAYFFDDELTDAELLRVAERRCFASCPTRRDEMHARIDLPARQSAYGRLVDRTVFPERRNQCGSDAGKWDAHVRQPPLSTSCIVNQPRRPSSQRAASRAPAAKPRRSRAV